MLPGSLHFIRSKIKNPQSQSSNEIKFLEPNDQVKGPLLHEKILALTKSTAKYFDVFRFMKYFFPPLMFKVENLVKKKKLKKNIKFIYNHTIPK